MRTRRIVPALAALICVATLLLSACTGGDGNSNTYRFGSATAIGKVIPPKDRKPAPELRAKLLDGNGSMSVAQHKGKPVVLAFWGSWCPPCRVEMPQLSQLNTQLAGKVAFVGVDSRDAAGPARAFIANNKISFPSIVDTNGELPQKLGNVPGNLPFTLLVDAKGKVAAIYLGRYGAKDLSGALSTLHRES